LAWADLCERPAEAWGWLCDSRTVGFERTDDGIRTLCGIAFIPVKRLYVVGL